MKMKDKIAPYVEQGLNHREIHALHPEWNIKTIYGAMHPEMLNKPKKKKEKDSVEKVERPKGWNKDKKACKNCQYRGRRVGRNCISSNGCNYILVEGHSRGCKVEDCNCYIKGKQIKLNPNGALNSKHDVTEMEY